MMMVEQLSNSTYVTEDGTQLIDLDVVREELEKQNKQREGYKKKLEIENNRKQGKFFNTVMDAIDTVDSILTNAQIGYLFILSTHVDYNGRVRKSAKDYSKVTDNDLMEMLGIKKSNRKALTNFKKACIDAGIMAKADGHYYLAKQFIFKGEYKGKGINVVSAVTTIIKDLSKQLKPEELAILFKLQKYVHSSSLVLCRNPQEDDPYKVDTMDITEVADDLGITRQYLSGKMSKLTYKGSYLIAKVKTGDGKTKIMLNPQVIFRGDYGKVQKEMNHMMVYFIKK